MMDFKNVDSPSPAGDGSVGYFGHPWKPLSTLFVNFEEKFFSSLILNNSRGISETKLSTNHALEKIRKSSR